MKWLGSVLSSIFILSSVLGGETGDIEKLSQVKESDSRMQADLKGWRLDKAKITDPSLPRVLLAGDSILGGYNGYVVKALAGKANVDVWIHPHYQSTALNKLLAGVLDQGPYDVVHFNMGLHGWPKGRIDEKSFEPLTRAFVEVIKSKLPKAKIIWANTTPVMLGEKGKPAQIDPEINSTILNHNRMAANVMTEMGVPINDFYSLLIGKLDLSIGDKFHWTGAAYKILADAATTSINMSIAPSSR